MPSQSTTTPAKSLPSARTITKAVDALAAIDERRLSKRQRFSIESNDATAEDLDSASPVMDRYIAAKGVEVVHALTNFSASELNTLWTNIKPFVTKNWNVGSGRKYPVIGKDMLFMTLVALKHAGTWDILSASFDGGATTFSNRINQFIRVLHPYLVRKYIDEQGMKWTMQQLAVAGLQFATHKSALYAVDVTFQHTTAPAVSFGEKKTYFSKKHGLYGHKVEVSVAPNGLTINVTDCAVGSTNRATPTSATTNDALRDKFPSQWSVLADKGYQGTQEYVRGFTPLKRPPHGQLTMEQERSNAKLSSDRVIVKNFFGRLKTLWGLASDKYTWKKDEYNMYFQMCVALTNVHIRFNPLRNVDGEGYNQYKNRLLPIGSKIKTKNSSFKAKYRKNRKARIQAVLGRANTGYTSEDYDIGYEDWKQDQDQEIVLQGEVSRES
ncbi:hypothetical protein H257_10880 [Aphanomyces astaci]|uniref:DDE Tnp4 domain-containing protein n=1 Tax=Aphanomyces astaci TaxID=112090 RepID=W4G6X7_APHAT|nr:hypothetical protein H257_10880 [Aphanomyces astaci]ETV74819.1 hypothetical protein H257_10880 [Aphanomyces astaci]|eukprot:XP_009835906.1 hypothetical protein H257_10880 [Aphanomyces astaci]